MLSRLLEGGDDTPDAAQAAAVDAEALVGRRQGLEEAHRRREGRPCPAAGRVQDVLVGHGHRHLVLVILLLGLEVRHHEVARVDGLLLLDDRRHARHLVIHHHLGPAAVR